MFQISNAWSDRRRLGSCETSTRGSQDGLLDNQEDNSGWKNSLDFLASTFAFTLSSHSLLSLPVVVLNHGGLAFLLLYAALLVIIGFPLILLEMFLGQYSSMSPGILFHHLCPLLVGLGPALCLQAGLRAILQLSMLMWTSQAMYQVFQQMEVGETIFSEEYLNPEYLSLANIGSMDMQCVLILGIVSAITFLVIVGGIQFIGNICKLCVPTCFLVMVTLTIRTCLASGGSSGVSTFLTPDWTILTEPSTWLVASCQVIFSLNIGCGGVTVYASYNKYHYNIVRDSIILIVAHLLWVLQAVVLSFSLLGVAGVPHTSGIQTIQLGMAAIQEGWLWLGLLFILLILLALSSLLGFLQVIITSIIHFKPHFKHFYPLISLIVMCVIFIFSLALTIPSGIHFHKMLYSHVSTIPVLIISLLTVLAIILSHGIKFLMEDISEMIMFILPYWFTSNLSSVLYTLLPWFLVVCIQVIIMFQ